MTVPSSSASETLGWLGQFPKMREWLGDRVINSLAMHGWTITNRRFESTVWDDKIGKHVDPFCVSNTLQNLALKTSPEVPTPVQMNRRQRRCAKRASLR
jgi:hypothetical protein